ncbi:MAG TPA: methyltransferase domain-containing protein [Usitatibacter sp.]|nr:methyltransferase domain-containing protein [Usitatibacter sp.]
MVALRKAPRRHEKRTEDRLRLHYMVERRLADQVRAASGPEERRAIFATMYDELFRLVPDHPRLLARKHAQAERDQGIEWDMAQLNRFLRPDCVFLEIGAGDCALACRVAQRAGYVYAVDISDQTRGAMPDNVSLVLSNGRDISVPAGSVDVAFSDQLMEHLHPDDAMEQLRNIHRALRPGGVYVCITPNRLYGPSDISAYFDDVARGFHLREYTVRELRHILREAGFPRIRAYIGARGFFVRCPALVIEALEAALEWLPTRVRRGVADNKLVRALLGVRVAAVKDGGSAP